MNDHHDPTRSSGSPDPLTGEPGATLFDWPRQAGMTDTVLHAMAVTLTRRRRRHRLLGAATGVGIALLVGTTWQLRREQLPGGNAASTAIVSAPVRQMLEDGSLLELKEGAQISVDFTGALRRVILNRGEAHFDVAKDPTRDFVVQADGFQPRVFEFWFEGDPMIKDDHLAGQAKDPDRFLIRKAVKDTNKVWQITNDIVLERM